MFDNRNEIARIEGPQAVRRFVSDPLHMTTMGHALVTALEKTDDIHAIAPVFVGHKLKFTREVLPGKHITKDSGTTLLGVRHARRIQS